MSRRGCSPSTGLIVRRKGIREATGTLLRRLAARRDRVGGFDPLTGAPAPISALQRREAGVDAAAPVKPATGRP